MFTVLLNRRVRIDSPNNTANGAEGTVVAAAAGDGGQLRVTVAFAGRPMRTYNPCELVLLPVDNTPAPAVN